MLECLPWQPRLADAIVSFVIVVFLFFLWICVHTFLDFLIFDWLRGARRDESEKK